MLIKPHGMIIEKLNQHTFLKLVFMISLKDKISGKECFTFNSHRDRSKSGEKVSSTSFHGLKKIPLGTIKLVNSQHDAIGAILNIRNN